MSGEKERRAKGLCWNCTQPAEPGKTMCAQHRAAHLEKALRHKTKAIEKGMCAMCLIRPRTTDRRCCQPCLDRVNGRGQKRLAGGLCRACGRNPFVEGRTYCARCLENRTAQRLALMCSGNWLPVLARDQHLCRLCSSDKNVVVHHIDGHGKNGPGAANDDPSNLIALCRACHNHLESLLRTCADPALLAALIHREPLSGDGGPLE